ncbi:type I glyceraldehyde-3-phosphate dehydrogenase [Patescibacteria group bacterium]
MSIKVGINGFGRIGRLFYRATMGYPDIEIVGVNDLDNAPVLAHLLKYDTVHGVLTNTVQHDSGELVVDGHRCPMIQEPDPTNLPWSSLGAEFVLESTGIFRDRNSISGHLSAGAQKVLLTVSGKTPGDVDATIVMGVNDSVLTSDMTIVSNGTCTTNCLAPVAKSIHAHFVIRHGFASTIHAYTGDQNLTDAAHKDARRARNAAQNIIPASTGAASAIGLVLPELDGLLSGIAMRTPVSDASLLELILQLDADPNVDALHEALRADAAGSMTGFLAINDDPIVSSDVIGRPESSIFDTTLTHKWGPKLFYVGSWYDNEWAYVCRLIDVLRKMAA